MKFMMNGALTIGTRDGATIEMAEAAGEENFFLFGLTAEQVAGSRGWYSPHWHYEHEAGDAQGARPDLLRPFQPQRAGHLRAVARAAADPATTTCIWRISRPIWRPTAGCLELYADPQAWTRKAILNIASSGQFSSDRTIAEYASEIWGAKPCPVP